MASDTALTNVIEKLSIIDPVQPGTITNPMAAGSALIKNEARPETTQGKPQLQAECPKRFEYIELIKVTVDVKPKPEPTPLTIAPELHTKIVKFLDPRRPHQPPLLPHPTLHSRRRTAQRLDSPPTQPRL
jgi:hypothetical protein